MRSSNTAIGIAGALAMFVFYIAGGVGVGLFLLMRQRAVVWRQPVFWGTLVAIAQTLASINSWPLVWMDYDTALSSQAFLAQQIAVIALGLVVNVFLFTLSFMAAESLTRRAFPQQPQLWRLWSRDAAASREVAGATAGAYLLVPLFIAYDVALYVFATRSLGWWTPSEALFTPDVLAAYAPWFTAIAQSFQAGFWEESLFRAVPIAGAALIGDRFGGRRWWIAGAFVVQALIFGAGHAPYPTQPAYARPVELILPSIGFGLLYLQFGLLPGIILHFTFDAFWFAIPLFASNAPGIRIQQILIVAIGLTPLWIVVANRLCAGAWRALPAALTNAGWQPTPAKAEQSAGAAAPHDVTISPSRLRSIVAAGVIALAATIAITVIAPGERQPLRATRTAVAAEARRTVPAAAGPGWRFLPVPDDRPPLANRFVWQTAGRSTYASLAGTYLDSPGWTVFVRTFQGDVAERAESWTVHLDPDGAVRRVSHELPEARPGATLDVDAARRLAAQTMRDRFGLDAPNLNEVSVVPSKLPARTDWTVTDRAVSQSLPQGEARASVRIAGDEIADARRFV
ncbi:MAG TPA: type II CAAX endopeptidase family protein, partial [Vicinamibacterales bacterium]|nr:type II CAAX endopeptidase family protein [Vicinamibacterales bacterium]